MHKPLLIVSSFALGAALMWGGDSFAQDRGDGTINPRGGWSVAKIDGGANPADSYCALSRQYDQDLALTLGRNAQEEYSLALDFQGSKLDTDKAYDITLQPGPGQLRAYQMLPASDRALVVRLGYDDSFVKALEGSGVLKAEIDGKDYNFNTPDFEAGRADLDNCLAKLKPASATKLAKGFSAEKVQNAPPIKVANVPNLEPVVAPKVESAIKDAPKLATKIEPVKADAAKVQAAVEAPKIEIAKVEAPNVVLPKAEIPKVTPPKIEISKIEPTKVAPVKIETPKIETPTIEPAKVAAIDLPDPKIEAAKIEITRTDSQTIEPKVAQIPTPPPVEAPRVESSFKPTIERIAKPVAAPSVSANEVENKIQVASAEETRTVSRRPTLEPARVRSNNDALVQRAEVSRRADLRPTSVARAKVTAPKIETPKTEIKAPEVKAVPAPQVAAAVPVTPKPFSTPRPPKYVPSAIQKTEPAVKTVVPEIKTVVKEIPNPVDAKLKADVEKLRLENERLKVAAQAVPDPVVPAAPKIDPEVVKQLETLRAENVKLSNTLQGQQEKLSSFDAKSPQAEKELAAVRAKLSELEAENRKLYLDAREARGQIDSVTIDTGNQAIKRIREVERKYEAAQSDNLALSKEIEELRRLKEDGRLASVSGDWDLEKSTKRYNEAEREIKRLGLLLEQQRVAHRQERTELEQMLFDPAVTDNEQRRRLAELETQLAAAERQLEASGRGLPARVNTRPAVPRSPLEERVQIETVSSLTPNPAVNVQRENLEIARLNNQLARQNQQLQAYKRGQEQEARRVAKAGILPTADRPVSISARPAPIVPAPITPSPINSTAAPLPVVSSAVVAAPLPVPPTPRVARAPTPRVPDPVIRAAEVAPAGLSQQTNASGFGQGQLQQLLQQSGVPLSGSVSKQSATQYRWSAGRLTGQAQIMPKSQAGNIDQFAQSFINKAKQSCGGDFASLPSAVAGQGKAFEIACISPTRSTSSSIVFTQKGGDLIAIAHETSADDMDSAMDARDRVASKL